MNAKMKSAKEWFDKCLSVDNFNETEKYSHVSISNIEAIQKDAREDLQQEEVRRIRHLNRIASWAHQDCTGPIVKDQIQAWVLAELKAALGSAYDPTSWQPEVPGGLQPNLQEAVALLLETPRGAVWESKRDAFVERVKLTNISKSKRKGNIK